MLCLVASQGPTSIQSKGLVPKPQPKYVTEGLPQASSFVYFFGKILNSLENMGMLSGF